MKSKIRFLLILLLISVIFLAGTAHAQLAAVGSINTEFGFPAWFQDANGERVQICDTPGATPCPSFGVVAGTIAEAPYYSATAEILLGLQRFIGVFAVEALGGIPAPGPVSNSIRIRLRNLAVAGNYIVTTPVGQFTLTATAGANGAIPDIDFIFPPITAPTDGLSTDNPPFSGALAGPVQIFQRNGTCPVAGVCTDGFFGDGFNFGRLGGILGNLPVDGLVVTGGPANEFRVQGPGGLNAATTDFVVEGKSFVLEPPQQTIATFTRDATGAGSVNVKTIGAIGASTVDVIGSDNVGLPVPLPGEPATGFPMAPVVAPVAEPGNWSTSSTPAPQIPIVAADDPLPGFVVVTVDRQPLPTPPPAPVVAQTATLIAPLTDAVIISEANFDAPTGVLTITASSSDAFPNPDLPILTVVDPGPPAVLLGDIIGSGTVTVNNPTPVPTTVNVTSTAGGRASLAVTGVPAPDPGAGVVPVPTTPAVGGGGGGGGCFIGTVTSK